MEVTKLKPALKHYIWGGTKLKSWGKETSENNISECWEFSFHDDGKTLIDGTNIPLKDVATKEDLGSNLDKFDFFPVLIKLIDSADNLSVQVHPSDDYALKYENSLGKTEMWYIIDADDNCGIYVGFKNNENKESLKKSIEDGTIIDKLNFFKVKKGECYFIPSGTIHAIGKGVTLIEIQQNSNLTYRLYDYKRKDKNGNYRELHVDKALKVVDFKPYINKQFTTPCIGKCKYFTSYEYDECHKNIEASDKSFITITFIDGVGKLNDFEFKKGDTFFIPANKKASILSDKCKYILTTIE